MRHSSESWNSVVYITVACTTLDSSFRWNDGEEKGLTQFAALDSQSGVAGELVGYLIVGVAGMAFDPFPCDLVGFDRRQQFLPQIGIGNRFLGSGLPPIFLPAIDPFGDAIADIDAVGGKRHITRFGERVEGLNRRFHFHAVVGAVRFAAGKALFVATKAQDRAPTARAGIALARAIGCNDHFGKVGHEFPNKVAASLVR